MPPPQATSSHGERAGPEIRQAPGASATGGAASPTAAAWIFRSVGSGPLPGAMAVKAVGVGENARIRAAKADAASVQSRARSRLPMRGARLAPEFSWGTGSMVPPRQPVEGLDQELGPDGGKPGEEAAPGVILQDRRPALRQHRPGVESGIHQHRGDAGVREAARDRPGGGGRPAKFGKQRSVDIHGAEAGDAEQAGREDLSVIGHHQTVGSELRDRAPGAPRPDPPGFENREPEFAGDPLDPARTRAASAAGGPVGLGHDGEHPVVRGEPAEHGFREGGGAEEDDPKPAVRAPRRVPGAFRGGHSLADPRSDARGKGARARSRRAPRNPGTFCRDSGRPLRNGPGGPADGSRRRIGAGAVGMPPVGVAPGGRRTGPAPLHPPGATSRRAGCGGAVCGR